ncbi:MAG: rhamnogalacturonan acetylesterase [Bacteroidales bacterium]|nr:rhamnogalacturonan acetylesterase [Bacteroidales bacterium]
MRTNKLILYAALAAFALCSCGQQKTETAFTIHLCGDSTCAPKDMSKGSPERGWGMLFPNYCDDAVRIVNHARNGRSTRSFRTLGHWDRMKADLKAGDYVFLQFGHNDAKQDDTLRYAPAWTDYKQNLERFIDEVREAGATPVLLTPVSRRWFKEGVLDENCHTDYPAVMAELAKEKGVVLLDIYADTRDWLKELGDEASKPYFMQLAPGECEQYPEGRDDNTHTVERGAFQVATFVVERIKACPELKPLAKHLVKFRGHRE